MQNVRQPNITLYLNIEQEENAGFCMTFYSPYWIVNHTNLPLIYAEGTYFGSGKTITDAIQSEIDLPDQEEDEDGDFETHAPLRDRMGRASSIVTVGTDKKLFQPDPVMYHCPNPKCDIAVSIKKDSPYQVCS